MRILSLSIHKNSSPNYYHNLEYSIRSIVANLFNQRVIATDTGSVTCTYILEMIWVLGKKYVQYYFIY